MILGSSGYGDKVRAARQAKGLTQAQLGALLNVHKSFVSDLEHERREPSERVAIALSKVLNVQWYKSAYLLNARIVQLESALLACRKPIICSVFGMPDEEVRRLVTLIDTALQEVK